jgi:ribonuclease HI
MGLSTTGTVRHGWGFIIRDDQGAVVTAGAGKEQFLQNAFHAEFLGCLAGLKAADQLGIRRVVLETDASLVKAALEDDAYRLSATSGVTTELRLLLMTEFAYSKAKYVYAQVHIIK